MGLAQRDKLYLLRGEKGAGLRPLLTIVVAKGAIFHKFITNAGIG